MFDAHRGGGPALRLGSAADGRIPELDSALQALEGLRDGSAAGGPVADSHRVRQLRPAEPVLAMGVVVAAVPMARWYAVQTREYGRVGASDLTEGSVLPMGVRGGPAYPTGTPVLLYRVGGRRYVILGALPSSLADDEGGSVRGLLHPGGGSGDQREISHNYPVTQLPRHGGASDFSAGAAADATGLDWYRLAETGVGLMVDPFQAILRATDRCGVFANLLDEYLRVEGRQLDFRSAAHELSARDDEGELRLFTGVALYPWEAVGLYGSGGGQFSEEYDPKEAQFDLPVGPVDVPDQKADIQPVYRWQEYGGYLGQGHLRLLARPAKESGVRRVQDRDVDEGLFCESVAADGEWSVRTAKSFYLGRRTKIVVPKLVRTPEDKAGDDAEADNYKFSGQFGGGPEHKLAEVKVEGEYRGIRRAAAALDLIAYAANWKALHPFHYHTDDFHTPQESEQNDHFAHTSSGLDFGELDDHPFLSDPEAKVLKIDHRYADAEYFERESAYLHTVDGSIVEFDGWGSSRVMAGGKIRLDAPGDIEICAGRTLILQAGQVVVKGLGGIDVSSANGAVRVKAETDFQALAGNGGTGSLLLESKGVSDLHDYEDKVGDDVVGGGVVVKSAAGVALLGRSVYVRTGGPLGSGDIVLDADGGHADVVFSCKDASGYLTGSFALWYGPSSDSSDATAFASFAPSGATIDASLSVGGNIVGYGSSGLIVDGSVAATGSVACAGGMADAGGGLIGKVTDGFGDNLRSLTQAVADAAAESLDAATQAYRDFFTGGLYDEHRIGNDDTITDLGFSFRDDDDQKQYRSKGHRWAEAHWVQLVRLGLASGGRPWDEPAVTYQGRQLYPWPGRVAWKEDSQALLRLQSLNFYDAGAGYSKDRPGPYEEPELAGWDSATLAQGFVTNWEA